MLGIAIIFSVNANAPAKEDAPIHLEIIAECNEYANAHLMALQWQQTGTSLTNASLMPENRNALMQDALTRVYTIRTTIPAEILQAKMFRRCMGLKNKVTDYSIYQAK